MGPLNNEAPLDSSIVIADYDPAWPEFVSSGGRANPRCAHGSMALRIEHAGSTSVPGLAAKPIIDIVINLHVFSAGCPEIDRMLMFRDWLRHNEDDRELYARTKLALAAKQWSYLQEYADAKTAVVEETMARAERYHQKLRAAST